MICEYGCRQEAKYQLKNGKWCCSKSYNSCPKIKQKISQRRLKNIKKVQCPYCLQNFEKGGLYNHLKKCKQINLILHSEKVLLSSNDLQQFYLEKYNKIILHRQLKPLLPTDIYEIHHIVPKCLGGMNEVSNLICLTPREHYICHALLAYASRQTVYNTKLFCAFFRMSTKNNQKINSRLYEKLKVEFKNEIISRPCTTKGKITINKDGKNKFINPDQLETFLLEGWVRGLHIRKLTKHDHIKGKIRIEKEGKRKYITKNELPEYLNQGWLQPIKTWDSKKYYQQKRLSKRKTSTRKVGWLWVTKETQHKQILKDELDLYLNDGWVQGINLAPTNGKILINNNIIQKFIYATDLEDFLQDGWFLGGIKGLKSGKPKSFRTKEHCLKLSKSNKGKHTH